MITLSKDKKRNGKGVGNFDKMNMTATGKKSTGGHPKKTTPNHSHATHKTSMRKTHK